MNAGLGMQLEHGVVVPDQPEFEHPDERPHVAATVPDDLEPQLGNCATIGSAGPRTVLDDVREVHWPGDPRDPSAIGGHNSGRDMDDHKDASGAPRTNRSGIRLGLQRLAGKRYQQGVPGGLLIVWRFLWEAS